LITKIKQMKDLNMDYLAVEKQVFHFDDPSLFYSVYSPESKDKNKVLKKISSRIVSVFASFGEYPNIRYQSNTAQSNSLATFVQEGLDKLMRSNPEYSNQAQANGKNKTTLLILDRSSDVVAPLLHEFTYQAMIYDLIGIQSDKYTYDVKTSGGETQQKEVLLSEADPLYPTLRHMHIADCMNWILEKFNAFVAENKASKLSSNKVVSLKEMAEAMKQMPQFQEMLSKYSLHINLAGQCMKIFGEKELLKVASLEQEMATGEDAEGKEVKAINILKEMPSILENPNRVVEDKIRLLMLYIISQEGIKETDRKRLLELANLKSETEIVNLRYLGISLSAPQKKTKQKIDKSKKRKMIIWMLLHFNYLVMFHY